MTLLPVLFFELQCHSPYPWMNPYCLFWACLLHSGSNKNKLHNWADRHYYNLKITNSNWYLSSAPWPNNFSPIVSPSLQFQVLSLFTILQGPASCLLLTEAVPEPTHPAITNASLLPILRTFVCTFLGASEYSPWEHIVQSSYVLYDSVSLKSRFHYFWTLFSLSPRHWSYYTKGPKCKFVKCMNECMNIKHWCFLQWHHHDKLEIHSAGPMKASTTLQQYTFCQQGTQKNLQSFILTRLLSQACKFLF